MQIMHDSTAPQIKHILPDATVAGATTLPTANMRQRMFDGHALPQLCTSLRRLLAFPQRLQQGFLRMNTDAAARRARGAALAHHTASTNGRGKLHDSPRRKGHDLAPWTPQDMPLPIQVASAFWKIRPWTHRPGLTKNGPLLATLLYQLTGPIRPVNGQFLPRALLGCQVGFYRISHLRLRHVGRRDAHRNDQTRVQVTQPMAFVAIH